MASSNQVELSDAISALHAFCGPNLTQTIERIETSLQNTTAATCVAVLEACGTRVEVLSAAGLVKRLAGQIHVIIHALGILLCLPRILKPGEVIEYVSLGAGNTGRPFDLETNQRIAEFKFIHWQGGAEAIRQNALFKDFYGLAEYPTERRKFLYVLGTEIPEKFLTGERAISSVFSRNVKLWREFEAKYGSQCRTVSDYYLSRKNSVVLQDDSAFVPELISAELEAEDL